MKDDSLENFNISNTTDKYQLMRDFIQYSLYSFQYMYNKDFTQARKGYKKCVDIANKLEDEEIKQAESQLNYSIASYYCGRYMDAKKALEEAYSLSSRMDFSIGEYVISLNIRVLCNIIMVMITLNNTSESKKYIDKLFEFLEKSNKSLKNKVRNFEEVLFTFFRLRTIVKIKDDSIDVEEEENKSYSKASHLNENDKQAYANQAVIAIHKYLKNGNSVDWFQLLAEEAEHFKQERDVNGLMFTLINQSAVNYIKTGSVSETASENFEFFVKKIREKVLSQSNNAGNVNTQLLSSGTGNVNISSPGPGNSLNIGNGNLKEKTNERILSEMKTRYLVIRDLYNKLYEYEEILISNQKQKDYSNSYSNSNSNSKSKSIDEKDVKEGYEKESKLRKSQEMEGNKVLTKVILKNCENIINENESMDEVVRSHFELCYKLISISDTKYKGMNILKIDSEIIKSIKQLYSNLCLIYNKCRLYHFYMKFKLNTLNYLTKREYLNLKHEKNLIKFEEEYMKICQGENLHKLNFKSIGITQHYYKLNHFNRSILIYKNHSQFINDKSYSEIFLNEDVVSVEFGLNNSNITSKYSFLMKKHKDLPWLFMSFKLNERSIDLYLNENTHKSWYIGIKYIVEIYDLKCKVPSFSEYFIYKLKTRMLYNIVDFYEKYKNDESVTKNHSFIVVDKIQLYVKENLGLFTELPFYKIFSFYRKIAKEYHFFSFFIESENENKKN